MDKKSDCPSVEVLQALFQGRLIDPKLSALSSHVEECIACQQVARTLSPPNTLVDEIRRDFTKTNEIARGIPAPLLQKLKNIRWELNGNTEQTAALSDSQMAEPNGQADLSFLSPPQQPDEIGRLGIYRVLQVLGKGGMGMVFLAEDLELDRQVALKVMLPKLAANPSAKQRFLREARAAAKLRDDHIVTIFRVSEDRGVPFLAMELLDGMSLDEVLQTGQTLAVPEILRIGREIAQGLAAAHEKGLVHRDIKPANLWLDRAHSGRVKILDFGLARLEGNDVHITQSGAIVGTPAYMAPEQGRGERNVDARADLFSLGCVLYRLCAGDIPFKAETTMGVLTALAIHVPPAPHKVSQSIPQELSEFIMQLLEKDPARRPAPVKEVIARIADMERNASTIQAVTAATPHPRGPRAVANTTVSQTFLARSKVSAPWRRSALAVAVALGFVAAAGALLGSILYIVTDNGTIEIETADKNVQVIVEDAGGKVTIIDPLSKQTCVVNTGKYTIRLGDNADGLEIELPRERAFEMKRGGKQVVTIRKVDRLVAADKKKDARAKDDGPAIRTEPSVPLFNGKDLTGWKVVGHPGWSVVDGVFVGDTESNKFGFLMTEREFTDYDLEFEVKLMKGADSGLFPRAWADGAVAGNHFVELQLIDNQILSDIAGKIEPLRQHGALVELAEPTPIVDPSLGAWQSARVRVNGKRVQVWIGGKKVSDSQVESLRDKGSIALQLCLGRVEFRNLRLRLPANDPERGAAEWVLSVGGKVQVNDIQKVLTAAADLPLDPIRLNYVYLRDNQQVNDAEFVRFRPCRNIKVLHLEFTKVSDNALANFKDCKDLVSLNLGWVDVTDTGFAHFKDCKNLTQLRLYGTQVGDMGLVQIKSCKDLRHLALTGSKISDAGLANLADCKELSILDLSKTAIGDAGVVHLKDLKNLTVINLRQTKVTVTQVEELKKALPHCKIESDGNANDVK